ncbi:hypothetical protein GCM10010498_48300 [Streptomyces cavourensis]|nr:hypothetical protein GCM10010498_48300 [Streptomyces cavourensis]
MNAVLVSPVRTNDADLKGSRVHRNVLGGNGTADLPRTVPIGTGIVGAAPGAGSTCSTARSVRKAARSTE